MAEKIRTSDNVGKATSRARRIPRLPHIPPHDAFTEGVGTAVAGMASTVRGIQEIQQQYPITKQAAQLVQAMTAVDGQSHVPLIAQKILEGSLHASPSGSALLVTGAVAVVAATAQAAIAYVRAGEEE